MTTRTLPQKYCARTDVEHPAHNWTWRPYGGASTHVNYRCSGRPESTCKRCAGPARNDGSDYSDVCTQWPHCSSNNTRTLPQQHCRNLADHPAHIWVTSPKHCPGRHTPSHYAAPKPSPAQPSDPFTGIDESTGYDATRPAVS